MLSFRYFQVSGYSFWMYAVSCFGFVCVTITNLEKSCMIGFLKWLDLTSGNTSPFSRRTAVLFLFMKSLSLRSSSITFPQSCFTPCLHTNWHLPSSSVIVLAVLTVSPLTINVSITDFLSKSLTSQTISPAQASSVDNLIIRTHAEAEIPNILLLLKFSISTFWYAM